MVFNTNYYALICSLPVLPSLEDVPPEFGLEWFFNGPYEMLSPRDRKLVSDWVLFDFNVMNVQRYSKELFDELHPLGWNRELIKSEMESEEPSVLPEFALQFLSDYAKGRLHKFSAPCDSLWRDAYAYARNAPLAFLRNRFRFEYELRNILTVYRCKQENRQPQGFVVGIAGDEFVEQLLANYLGSSDFGMGYKHAWAKNLPQLFEGNPAAVETRLDYLRWQWLDDNEPFMRPFQIEVILAFLFKLRIVERWRRMNVEEGRQVVARIEKLLAEKLDF